MSVNKAFNHSGRMPGEISGFNPGAAQPERNITTKQHLIESIHYPQGIQPHEYDDVPVTCTCGWAGTSAGFTRHRLDNPRRQR